MFGPKAKDNEEIRGLLNAGHRRGAVAGRCVVKGKLVETEEIPAYCAVALAGLGGLPDTILSRVGHRADAAAGAGRARRAVPSPCPRARGARDPGPAEACGAASVEASADRRLAGDAARDRGPRRDIWEPLLAVADLAGGSGRSGQDVALLRL